MGKAFHFKFDTFAALLEVLLLESFSHTVVAFIGLAIFMYESI